MNEDQIKKDIQKKVSEYRHRRLQLSHTVTPFMIGNAWKASYHDYQPELKRRFH